MILGHLFTGPFEVVPAPFGGFTIMTSLGDKRSVIKAFTSLDDLIEYLNREKVATKDKPSDEGP